MEEKSIHSEIVKITGTLYTNIESIERPWFEEIHTEKMESWDAINSEMSRSSQGLACLQIYSHMTFRVGSHVFFCLDTLYGCSNTLYGHSD